MKITENTLDMSLELALRDLKKNLEPEKNNTGEISKMEILSKACELVRSGKLDLLEAGNVEGRINKGVPLSKAHRAILGLKPGDIIQGLREPAVSSVESRMGKAPGGSAARIATGSPAPENPVVAAMMLGQKLTHSFQQADGTVMAVSGSEILTKCAELVRLNKMSLTRSADIERSVNSALPLRPEILRAIFA